MKILTTNIELLGIINELLTVMYTHAYKIKYLLKLIKVIY